MEESHLASDTRSVAILRPGARGCQAAGARRPQPAPWAVRAARLADAVGEPAGDQHAEGLGESLAREGSTLRPMTRPFSSPLPALFLLLPLVVPSACSSPGGTFRPAPEESVKPGINEPFLDPGLDVDEFVGRFEGESREVFANRAAIVAAMGLEPGQDLVDVGAGTGPFVGLFADAVGLDGTVYAVDIAPRFLDHLRQRAKAEGHPNVRVRPCYEDSVGLPAASVDVAFICDVYHHFEFPQNSMGSLHHALRDGGEVFIVDFERIPGVSSEWILGHVRAGKDEVIAELDSFGFDLVEELEVAGLEDNWVGRFRRR